MKRNKKRNSSRANDKTEKMNVRPSKEAPSPIFYEVAILVTVLVCLLLFLSNFGWIGPMGDFLSRILFGLFGLFAFLFPLALLTLFGYGFYLGRLRSKSNKNILNTPSERRKRKIKLALIIIVIFSFCVLTELIVNSHQPGVGLLSYYHSGVETRNGGGLAGGILVSISVSLIGIIGTYITTIIILLICIIALTGKPLLSLMGKGSKKAYKDVRKHQQNAAQHLKERRVEKAKQKMLKPSESVIVREDIDEEYDILYPDGKRPIGDRSPEVRSNRSETLMDLNPKEFEASSQKEGGFLKSLLSSEPKNVENTIPKGQLYRIYSSGEQKQDEIDEPRDERDNIISPIDTVGVSNSGSQNVEMLPQNNRVKQDEALDATKDHEHSQVFIKALPPKNTYKIPPLNLLAKSKNVNKNQDAHLIATAQKLEKVLADFGVSVNVTNASTGPSVTRYELQPEQGVKVSRIVGLTDDIKLNLAVPDIRIEAPIPGKAAVGIEVPNKESNPVMFRDLLESDEFKTIPSKIPFVVGRDIGGNVKIADIAQMPHLLIAGATGSGKSVCINTLIMSILYKATPDEVKLLMIDPKVVELSVYNGIPHLHHEVVTDPKKASGALNWAMAEMTRRYQLYAKHDVRDIAGYNEKAKKLNQEREMDFLDDSRKESSEELEILPKIVIIIDELADLMMVAPSEVESAICRLAQLARAAGIHLIVATQRPSVNVITGLIKANMPSRIAFSVASGVDSRTIIDMNGAEKLLGRGDMLFYPSGFPKPIRVQGSFISDEEVRKIVDYLKKQKTKSYPVVKNNIQKEQPGVPGQEIATAKKDVPGEQDTYHLQQDLNQSFDATQMTQQDTKQAHEFHDIQTQELYDKQAHESHDIQTHELLEKQAQEFQDKKVQELLEKQRFESQTLEIEDYINGKAFSDYPGAPAGANGEDERDEYYIDAGFLIIDKEKASIGMLQRMFRIGFNRAARIMDQLHQDGVVSGEEGTKPRNILMSREEFQQYIDEEGIKKR
jgi:S-DNA-T family DNA segregation ATPase FtsK/SpoIIIE